MTPADDFRAEFPVLEQFSYLNAGTEGPVPRRAAEAVQSRMELETTRGRCGRPYFEELRSLASRSRARYAGLLGCQESEVALTGSTTDGVGLPGLAFTCGADGEGEGTSLPFCWVFGRMSADTTATGSPP